MARGNYRKRTWKPKSRRLNLESLEARLCLSTYTTVDLMPLPADDGNPAHDHSVALGLNDNGLAVGRSGLYGDSSQRAAVVWSVDQEGDASVFPLPGVGGEQSVHGVEVNNDGMIAGESYVNSSYAHAVVWIFDSDSYVAHDLGTLGGEFVWSGAWSISEPDIHGNVWVVGTSEIDSGPSHGVLWGVNSDGDVVSTTDLEWGSWPLDVEVIGDFVFVAGRSAGQAVVWEADLNGNVVGQTELGTAEFEAEKANALNSDGDVVGWGYNSSLYRNGFIYEHGDGVITDLGSLGNRGSEAEGINDNDVVVGGYWDVKPPNSMGEGDHYAFVWESGTMHDLLDQVSDRTFWRLNTALDVNNNGEIVGAGHAGRRNDSQGHGFLARPEDAGGQHPPVANDDNYTVQPDTMLTVATPGVLGNDTDADGDSLTAVLDAGPSSGTLELSATGSFTYTPPDGFTGTDSFTYVANDGTADSNVATVTIDVSASETHHSTDTPLDIRDAHPKGTPRTTTSTLEVTNTSIASIGSLDLNISIDGGRTDITDLSAVLNNQQEDSHSIAVLTSGTYQMSAFNSDSLADTWTLVITDTVKKSPHVLTNWSLTATQQSGAATGPETASAVDAALLAWLAPDSPDDEDSDLLATQAADELALMLGE